VVDARQQLGIRGVPVDLGRIPRPREWFRHFALDRHRRNIRTLRPSITPRGGGRASRRAVRWVSIGEETQLKTRQGGPLSGATAPNALPLPYIRSRSQSVTAACD